MLSCEVRVDVEVGVGVGVGVPGKKKSVKYSGFSLARDKHAYTILQFHG